MNERIIFSIQNWLEEYKKNSVKAATYDRLMISFRLMEKYKISKIFLCELTTFDIQKYLNELTDDGYALTTIKKQFTLITAFLKFAYAQGMISSPLYLTVQMPREETVRKPAKEIYAYTEEEQEKLNYILNRMEDLTCGACILMLECGLRAGEALSLRWQDVIWQRKAIRIGKTLVKLADGETFVQDSPKSRSSKRTIPLSARAERMLRIIFEKSESKTGFVFQKNTRGGISGNVPASYAQLIYWLKKSCTDAKVPYYGCHSLRHTFASNCYNNGADVKILSKLLGHADVSITYNIYIHLFGDELEAMRKVIS